jgi:hypothetical protein
VLPREPGDAFYKTAAGQPYIRDRLMGAPKGRAETNAIRPPVRPTTRWLRMVSMASARGVAGSMEARRRADIDFPAPSGDLVSTPATGMASPWSQQGLLEILHG